MPIPTNKKEYLLTPDLSKKARLLEIAGDETRIRILCFMFGQKEGCVSDIAAGLDMSIAAVSHHLQIMRDNGILESERTGNMICYKLINNSFTRQLEKIICN